MPAYLVMFPVTAAPIVQGKRNAVVFAEDATAAKLAAVSGHAGDFVNGVPDYIDALFAGSTATEIVARTDLEGAILRVQINTPTPIDISVTGGSGDGVDEIAALMVTALNATAQIDAADYIGTNLLRVANTSDDLGDRTVTASFILNGEELSGFVGEIVDQGETNSALTVQLATDEVALPNVVATF